MSKSGIKILDTFVYSGSKYLDQRQEVANIDEMKALSAVDVPEGFITFCKANKTYYKFDSSYNDPTTMHWKSLGNMEPMKRVEVIDSLTSDRTDAALSAKQGKLLSNSINALKTDINGRPDATAYEALKTQIQGANTTISTATGNISTINGKINEAQTNASSAKSSAEKAKTDAEKAKTDAAAAKDLATTNNTKYGELAEKVTTAEGTANTAKDTANAAKDQVAQLQTKFNQLLGTGDAAGAIDTFNEIKSFLAGLDTSKDLTTLLTDLQEKLNGAIREKANKNDTYSKTEANSRFATKAEMSNATRNKATVEAYNTFKGTVDGKLTAAETKLENNTTDLSDLMDEVFPLILEISVDGGYYILRKFDGSMDPTSKVLTYSVKHKERQGDGMATVDVTSSCAVTLNGSAISGGRHTISYPASTATGYKSYKVVAKKGTQTTSKETGKVVTYPSFCLAVTASTAPNVKPVLEGAGAISGATMLAVGAKAYNKTISLTNQKILYAYPSSFGTLTKILDGNGFDNISSYDTWEGDAPTNEHAATMQSVKYRYYLLKNPTTATDIMQKYQ